MNASITAIRTLPKAQIFRHSAWDALLVLGAMVHGAALLLMPSIWTIAIGLWWNANTVAHNFVHLPFFRSSRANRCFSVVLSLLLGVPQELWKQRHIAHHAERRCGLKLNSQLLADSAAIALLWITLITFAPRFFFTAYLPGVVLGLCLCQLQGYYEHHRGVVSHYGRIYNTLFFNDGFHLEHHSRPATHWRALSQTKRAGEVSRWPAALRWMEWISLDGLERIVLRSQWLRNWVLKVHERALRKLLREVPAPKSIVIVGGGIFPRTALVLRSLYPDADIRIIDASAANLALAREMLADSVQYRHENFAGTVRDECDLITIPLAYRGNRKIIYQEPPALYTLVHDWFWDRRGCGAVVSWLLLKRINLLQA